MESPSPRIAYIRTTDEPDKGYDHIRYFLSTYMKQRRPDDPFGKPRHQYVFGALNACDTHILDIFLSDWIIPSPHLYGEFANIRRADLELHISISHAATGAGRRLRERCNNGGIDVVVSGADDADCEELMLQDCDYIIDRWTRDDTPWYWETAWAGILQYNILTNSNYDMSRHHDYSKRRLLDRYAGYGWTATSGGMHGNGGYHACVECGGKCKRKKCRINPGVERETAEWARLPAKGSSEWRSLSSEDACRMMQFQRLPSQPPAKDVYSSIDTFSGD
jgi:hypothetical protein